jgi:hypothetical protein
MAPPCAPASTFAPPLDDPAWPDDPAPPPLDDPAMPPLDVPAPAAPPEPSAPPFEVVVPDEVAPPELVAFEPANPMPPMPSVVLAVEVLPAWPPETSLPATPVGSPFTEPTTPWHDIAASAPKTASAEEVGARRSFEEIVSTQRRKHHGAGTRSRRGILPRPDAHDVQIDIFSQCAIIVLGRNTLTTWCQ